jgi:pimeloyl-ACP methyl ester carboxylesterase
MLGRHPSTGLAVTRQGAGTPVLLLHGWPHTHRIWDRLAPRLARSREVVAVDLPGLGDSAPPLAYDGESVAGVLLDLVADLDLEPVHLVAIDIAVPVAYLAATSRPDLIRSLSVMESLLMPLPGAEDFLEHGEPWWFGLHAVPHLPEAVLAGREGAYLDWFLTEHTFGRRGIPRDVRDAFVAAYTGPGLARGFEYYRAMRTTASQIAAAPRLSVPTQAIGGGVVGDALARQLSGVSEDLESHLLEECGHLVPLEQPERTHDLLAAFLTRVDASCRTEATRG